jgi:hypothetical protein
MDSNYLKKVRRLRALHHFEGFRASRETLLSCGIAFSSEGDTGSREENASKQESGASVLIQSERKL